MSRTTIPDLRRPGIRSTYELRSHTILIEEMHRRKLKTGYALAKAAGLKPGAVNHLVFGRRTTCSPETAFGIEDALDVRPGALFERHEYRVSGYPESRSTA